MIRTIVLFSIGNRIPENAQFPSDIYNIEKALQGIDVAYHMNQHVSGELQHCKMLMCYGYPLAIFEIGAIVGGEQTLLCH